MWHLYVKGSALMASLCFIDNDFVAIKSASWHCLLLGFQRLPKMGVFASKELAPDSTNKLILAAAETPLVTVETLSCSSGEDEQRSKGLSPNPSISDGLLSRVDDYTLTLLKLLMNN